MEYIRTVHSEGVTEVTSKVNSHKNTSDALWNSMDSAHSTRYSQLDGKGVDVDG